MAPIRVLLADDHPLVRAGLRALITSEAGIQIVGECGDGETACRLARELEPDVIVLDLSMPSLGGAETTERIRRDVPAVKVLVLTVHEEQLFLTKLVRAGAHGYVLKRSASDALIQAIRTVADSRTYIDPLLAGTIVESYLADQRAGAHLPAEVPSPREREVLIRIAHGFSNKEIAAALGLSVKTVESYKARITEKLGLRTRVEIVRYAARHGLMAGVFE